MLASAMMCKSCASSFCQNTKCCLSLPPSSPSSPSSPALSGPDEDYVAVGAASSDGSFCAEARVSPKSEERKGLKNLGTTSAEPVSELVPPPASSEAQEPESEEDWRRRPEGRICFGVPLSRMLKTTGTRIPLFVSDLAAFLARNFDVVFEPDLSTEPGTVKPIGLIPLPTHHFGGPARDRLWNLVASCDDFFFPWSSDLLATSSAPVLLTPASLHSHMACAQVTALKGRIDDQGLERTLASYITAIATDPLPDHRTEPEPSTLGGLESVPTPPYPTFLAELIFIMFLFLEKLPHSLVPHRVGEMMIRTHQRLCTTSRTDEDAGTLLIYRDILLKLPPNNYHLVAYLLTFLRNLWVQSHHEENLIENLITGFSCTVYVGEQEDFDAWWLIIRALMIHADEIFAKELHFVVLSTKADTTGGYPMKRHSVVSSGPDVGKTQFLKIYKGEKAFILPIDQILLSSKNDTAPFLPQSRSSPDFKSHHPHHHHHIPNESNTPPSVPQSAPPLQSEGGPVGHSHHHHHHHHHKHSHHHHPQTLDFSPRASNSMGIERSRSHPSEMMIFDLTVGLGPSHSLKEGNAVAARGNHPRDRVIKFYFGSDDHVSDEHVTEVVTATDLDDVTGAALALRPRMDVVSASARLEEILTRFEDLSSGSSGRSSLFSSTLSLTLSGHQNDYYDGTKDDDWNADDCRDNYSSSLHSNEMVVRPKALSSKRGSDATLVNTEFLQAKLHSLAPSAASQDMKWLENQVATSTRIPNPGSVLSRSWMEVHWGSQADVDEIEPNDGVFDTGDDNIHRPSANNRPLKLMSPPTSHPKFQFGVQIHDQYGGTRLAEVKDLPPPSPPATHHAYKGFFENGVDGAPFHTLYKKLQTYEKKLKHYEELYERENGFKPTETDKLRVYEMKKYNSKIDKVRKELKSLKARHKSGSPLGNGFSPESHNLSNAPNSAYERRGNGGDGSSPSGSRHCPPSPQQTLIEAILAYLPGSDKQHGPFSSNDTINSSGDNSGGLNRETLMRLLEDISPEMMYKQKMVLQKILLHFEKVHGKPTDKSTIDLMRPLYCKYRRIKNILAKYSPRHVMPELPTIIEGHQWDADLFDTSITSRGSLSSSASSREIGLGCFQSDRFETMHNRHANSCTRQRLNHDPDDIEPSSPVKFTFSRSGPTTIRETTRKVSNGSPGTPAPYKNIEMGTMEISNIHSASLQELLEERRKLKAIRHRFKKLAYIPVDLGPGLERLGPDLPEPMGVSPTATSPKAGGPRSSAKSAKFYAYEASVLDPNPACITSPTAAITTKRAYFVPNLEYYETYKMAKNKLKLVNALIAKLENQKMS